MIDFVSEFFGVNEISDEKVFAFPSGYLYFGFVSYFVQKNEICVLFDDFCQKYAVCVVKPDVLSVSLFHDKTVFDQSRKSLSYLFFASFVDDLKPVEDSLFAEVLLLEKRNYVFFFHGVFQKKRGTSPLCFQCWINITDRVRGALL